MESVDNSTPAGSRLRVSLVIPVKDEEGSLEALIGSIQSQTRPPEEIILVDGGSTDGTVDLARRLTRHDPRFRVLEAGEATPGRGRNVGIAAATYDWIALTDAGIRLEATWLERLVEVLQRDPRVRVVYGNHEPIPGSFFERCAALACVSPKRRRPGGWMRDPIVASSLIHRSVWRSVGGFPDLRASEDLIFMERIEQHGFRTGWAPEATVWWQLQPSLVGTFRKFVLYSKHNVWAGRQRHWHYGVARAYLAAALFLFLAILDSPLWVAVLLAGAAARVAKRIWCRREDRGVLWLLNPLQFLGVGVVLVALDMATLAGWVQAVLSKRAIRRAVRESLYHYGWDTRCRNLDCIRVLRSLLADVPHSTSARLLDAGCGNSGIASFLPDVPIVGVDLEPPPDRSANVTFQLASICELPFQDRAFPVVSCIDVLEHLSPAERERAISELVRVTRRHLLIACPHGQRASACDSRFLRAYQMAGGSPPSWVAEHQAYPYPDASSIKSSLLACARATGRALKVSLSYSEPIGITQILRRAALRSRLLYGAANLFFGAVYPMIPSPDAETSYRMILAAEMCPAPGEVPADRPKTLKGLLQSQGPL